MVYAYVSSTLQDYNKTYHLIYFDFDNFKMYNDCFGFRRGDRIILLFADLLKSNLQVPEMFIGHLGGDDFFAGVPGASAAGISDMVKCIAREFENGVKGFYGADALNHINNQGDNHKGVQKKMPLLTVSSVVLELPAAPRQNLSPEEVGIYSARLKKEAKQSPDRFRYATIQEFDQMSLPKKNAFRYYQGAGPLPQNSNGMTAAGFDNQFL